MSKFIAASRQATELDKTRILLEKMIKEVKEESKVWAEVAAKAGEEAKELRNLNEELKTDVLEKDTHLDHLQKKNNKLNALLEKAKGDAVVEFQASKQFTDLLDKNYAARFEDFRLDAAENFLNLDFSAISSTLVLLRALSSKQVQRTSILKTMLAPFLLLQMPRTILLPHEEDCILMFLFCFVFVFVYFLCFFFLRKCNSSTFSLVHGFKTRP